MNEFCLIYGTNIVKSLQNAEMMFVFIFQIDRKNAWYFFMKGCMVWLYLAFFVLRSKNAHENKIELVWTKNKYTAFFGVRIGYRGINFEEEIIIFGF